MIGSRSGACTVKISLFRSSPGISSLGCFLVGPPRDGAALDGADRLLVDDAARVVQRLERRRAAVGAAGVVL